MEPQLYLLMYGKGVSLSATSL